jgi:hypothetical protein
MKPRKERRRGRNRVREDRILVYSRQMERPEDWLHFVHFPYFLARWRELRFSDDDLRLLEMLIMVAPLQAPVVQGTGGLRKLRFARSDTNRGSSGGARVGYAYFPEFDVVGVFAVFSKDQQDNFTAEQKQQISSSIVRFRKWLEETAGRRGDWIGWS